MQKIDICLIGDVSVGKSSLVASLNKQNTQTQPTIGVEVDFYVVGNIKLRFWDTTGQVEFRDFIGSYYKKSDILMIVVSYDRLDRFAYWYDTAKYYTPDKPIILCINKVDLCPNKGFDLPEYVKEFDVDAIFTTSIYIRQRTLKQCIDTILRLKPAVRPVQIENPQPVSRYECCIIV